MSSVQMEGGKYTQFPVAARTPDKITIPDGLAGHHRLQPDHHHVFARLSECSFLLYPICLLTTATSSF